MAERRTPLFKESGGVALSRIFKALSQAGAIVPGRESFREDDHPWGTELVDEPIGEDDVADPRDEAGDESVGE